MQAAPQQYNLEALEQWKNSVRQMAAPHPGREEATLGEVSAVFSNVAFPLANAFFASTIVDRGAMTALQEFAAARDVPWVMVALNGITPPGLDAIMSLTYMATERLLPPSRQLPDLEYRPIDSEEMAVLAWDINCDAYAMPRELGRTAASIRMWQEGTAGLVGYLNGEPVTTATVIRTDGCRNVIMVATAEAHRRNGYAEAVMRRTLDAAGEGRMILHATRDGFPVYQRMGYQPLAEMTVWSLSH
jgi:hypothetical protein